MARKQNGGFRAEIAEKIHGMNDDQVDSTTLFLEYAQERCAYEVPFVPPIIVPYRPSWLSHLE